MRTGLLVLAACLVTASAVPKNPQRIVGGEITDISLYPYAAALLHSSSGAGIFRHACGGTILNNRSILSAAHCFYGETADQWRVRVGSSYASSGGTVYSAGVLALHENYDDWTLDNDVAILRIVRSFDAPNIATGSIAGTNYNLADNSEVWAIGWGSTSSSISALSSEVLRHVQVWTINQETCRDRYGGISDGQLCSGWLDVGGRDQCTGDSGGPLIHSGVIVGVCSWGIGCADPYYPGVNARVSTYSTWIVANA